MKLKKRLLYVVACLVLSLCMIGSPIYAATAGQVLITQQGLTPEEMDTMALDPQEWQVSRDMTWNDFKSNPVIDWDTELKPDSLKINTSLMNVQGRKIKGGLVLVDFLDRKFIAGQTPGSDPLGYKIFNKELVGETGKKHGSYDDKITKNPLDSILNYPEAYPNGYADLPKYYADFLNVPNKSDSKKPINNGSTINGYWLENSYGQWGVELIPKGVYTIPYFEFETMGSYQDGRDVPPTFRYALPSSSSASISAGGSGVTRSNNVDNHGTELAKRGSVFNLLPGESANPWGIPAGARGMSSSDPVDFNEFDFFFLLHAGYDESGAWQEFGQMQYDSRERIPYELGPGNRLKQVEKFFNDYPEWVPVYAARYANGWANYTGVWNTAQYNANDPAVVAKVNEYRQHAFWRETLEQWKIKYDPADPLYDPDATFVFKLPQQDWDWAEKYQGSSTDYVGRPHSTNTRYVPFTSWEAAVGEWSHAGSVSGNTLTYGNTSAGKSIRRSTQGENDGMATYAHEFSHLADIGDNYGNPWTDRVSPLTEPWDIMSRGSFAGPFGDHARWGVPGVEAGSVPAPATQSIKSAWNYYDNYSNPAGALNDESDLLVVNVADLAAGTPVVVNIVPRTIPLNNQYYDVGVSHADFVKGIQLRFDSNTTSPYSDKAVRSTTGYANFRGSRALRMGVEVVERTGYDSFSHDEGVLITRASSTTNSGHSVIDSHLYDIDMTDYYLSGVANKYPIAHGTQLADALFKAGKSYTDTGYYTGSEWKWEERNDRDIVSGDSVNEWHDPYNGLNFYILQKNTNEGKYGSFLSYQVAVSHKDGTPVGGELILVENAPLTPAAVGNYAKQTYSLTNTGDKTDIVRVKLDGALAGEDTTIIQVNGDIKDSLDQNNRVVPTKFSDRNAVLLNDLYAVGAGETIEFDVYVKTTTGNAEDFDLTVTAVSETNPEKVASAVVEAHSVTFVDWDGTVLNEQAVIHGEAAIAPDDPVREGWLFYGWDADFSEVSEDLVVTAQYSNLVSLKVAPNIILGPEREITVCVSVYNLGWSVMESWIKINDDRFEFTDISPLVEDENLIFTKNLDFNQDGTTAYFSLAQVGGIAAVAQVNVASITIKLKEGETADSLEAVLDSVAMYVGYIDEQGQHKSMEVPCQIGGDGIAETNIWIPSDELGDFDGDGWVDGLDLALALTYYGAEIGDIDWYTSGAWRVDFNKNGTIDIGDLTTSAYLAAHLNVEMNPNMIQSIDEELNPDEELIPEEELTSDEESSSDEELTSDEEITPDEGLTPDPESAPEDEITPDPELSI